ncbi:uncharacterized protein JCM6883_000593 [Sporobolomyces salmoneus]|uniref:uncharacterized protein n=1 Tax=Sporobolomyces salmoneus TaxID=183962 RepID=UPI00317B8B7E
MEQPTPTTSRTQPDEQTHKIDRFSSLPPELLDYIFEIAAASPGERSLVSPSKRLLPHHERAFYRSVQIDSDEQLCSFSTALDSQLHRTHFVKNLSFRCRPTSSAMFELLWKLPSLIDLTPPPLWPQLVEMVESGGKLEEYLGNLVTCRFGEDDVTLAQIAALNQLPRLRRVQISGVSVGWDADPDTQFVNVNQVTEIIATPNHRNFLTLEPFDFPFVLRVFPSAKIVSFEFDPNHGSDYDWLPRVIPPLAPTLETLRLTYSEAYSPSPSLPLDYLSDFTLLRNVSLSLSILPDPSELAGILSPLSNLGSLTLLVNQLDPSILRLFQEPKRLRRLEYLTLQYTPIWIGPSVWLEERAGPDWEYELELFEEIDDMEDMLEWSLPFTGRMGDPYMAQNGKTRDGIHVAEELENLAKGAGVTVRSNLEEVKVALWEHVIEYHNRGVARAYFNKDSSILSRARQLAELHGIPLPQLQINLDEGLATGQLDYYRENLTAVFDNIGSKEVIMYNLKYRQ